MHLQLATDIFVHGGRRSIWYVLSALHKEIRRGDTERALCWGRLYCKITSPNHLLRYIQKIIFEETRGLEINSKISTGQVSPIEALKLLCSEPKKWALPHLHEARHFESWIESYKAYCLSAPWDERKLEHSILSFTSLTEGYQTLFATSKNAKMKKVFWAAINLRLHNLGLPRVKAFLEGASSGYYSRQVAVEAILGILPEERPASIPDITYNFFIPCHRSYVFDIHHSIGKSLFKKLLPLITEGRDVSSFGYDQRWSGTVLGAAFRFSAFSQFGKDFHDREWSEVNISYNLSEILDLDRFFYGPSLIPELK